MKNRMLLFVAALFGALVGAIAGAASTSHLSTKEKNRWKELSDKHLAIMQLFNQWMMTKQEGKYLAKELERRNINTIAIYGMSYVGERLYDELKGSNIKIRYAIDKNADAIYSEIKIITPDEEFERVDAILVTPNYYFDSIRDMLENKTDIPVLSLEDILYEV